MPINREKTFQWTPRHAKSYATPKNDVNHKNNEKSSPKIINFLPTIRVFVLDITIILFVILLAIDLINECRSSKIIISDIYISPAIDNKTYSSEILKSDISEEVKSMLRNGITPQNTALSTSSIIPKLNIITIEKSAFDVQIPTTGMSYQAIKSYVKNVLGKKNIEIICELNKIDSKYKLKVFIRGGSPEINTPPLELFFTSGQDGKSYRESVNQASKFIVINASPFSDVLEKFKNSNQQCQQNNHCNYESALSRLDEISGETPTDLDLIRVHNLKGKFLAERESHEKEPNYDIAKQELKEAINLQTNYFYTYLGYEDEYIDNQNYIDICQKTPTKKISFEVFTKRKNTDKIFLYLKDPIALAYTYANLGDLYISMKDPVKACKNYLRAIYLDKRKSEYYTKLAESLEDMDASKSHIIEVLIESIKINFNNVYNHIGLAKLYHLNKQDDLAKKSYISALNINPKDVYAHLSYGDYFYDIRQYESAEAEYNEAAQYDPKDIYLIICKGRLLREYAINEIRNNNFNKAKELIERSQKEYESSINIEYATPYYYSDYTKTIIEKYRILKNIGTNKKSLDPILIEGFNLMETGRASNHNNKFSDHQFFFTWGNLYKLTENYLEAALKYKKAIEIKKTESLSKCEDLFTYSLALSDAYLEIFKKQNDENYRDAAIKYFKETLNLTEAKSNREYIKDQLKKLNYHEEGLLESANTFSPTI